MKKMLTTQEASDYLGVSKSWLEKGRVTGTGMPFVRLGRSIRYDIKDLDDYLQKHKLNSTSEY